MNLIEIVVSGLVILTGLAFAGLLFYWSYQMAVEAKQEKKLALK